MTMKYKIQIIIITLMCSNAIADYLDYNFTINQEPSPGKLFIHSMSTEHPHMGILNTDLSLHWNVYSHNQGFDFRENNEKLSYFDKTSLFWIIADKNMVELDTLQCEGSQTDYHDIRLLENGGYILQCYDSIWVNLELPTPQLIRDILVIQEFDNQDNLILEWNAMEHLSIYDYPDINLLLPEITFMHDKSIPFSK